MAASMNMVILMGNIGRDPEVRTMGSGDKVVTLSLATNKRWTDKSTGERREDTQWHRVVVFGPLTQIAEQYVRKGSAIQIVGELRTRKFQDQSGQDRYITEVVVSGPDAKLLLLGDRQSNGQAQDQTGAATSPGQPAPQTPPLPDGDDEIPF